MQTRRIAAQWGEKVDVALTEVNGKDRATMRRCLHHCRLIRSLNKDSCRETCQENLFTESSRSVFPSLYNFRARTTDARDIIIFRYCVYPYVFIQHAILLWLIILIFRE